MIVARALGLDLGLKKDRGVLSDVCETDTGLVCVLGLTTYTPPKGGRNDLREIETEATETALALGCPLALDPWQAVLLGQRASARGVTVLEYSFTSDGRRKLFARLLDLIRTGRFKCRPHEALRRELLGLEVAETTSGWRVDHKPGAFDDHVVSVGLAIAALSSEAAALAVPDTDMTREEYASLRAALPAFELPPWGAFDDPGNVVAPDSS